MFEQASRQAVRFDSPKGQLTTEDLWSLPLTSQTGKANLDDIARELYRQLTTESVSFVNEPSAPNALLQLKLDIVKHIINVRKNEAEAERTRKANADRRQQILQIINERETDDLRNKDLDELRKLVNSL